MKNKITKYIILREERPMYLNSSCLFYLAPITNMSITTFATKRKAENAVVKSDKLWLKLGFDYSKIPYQIVPLTES